MRMYLALLVGVGFLQAETTLLDGKKVFYESRGQGAETLLLIHGWAADHSFFQGQLDGLSKQMRVVVLDLPGHGQSEAPAAMEMASFVRAVESVRKTLNLNRLILGGHALGAVVARQYTRQYGNRVAGLIFLDGSIYQLPPGEQDRIRWAEAIRRMAASFGPEIEKESRERGISVFLSNLYTDATSRELRMQILRKALETSPVTAQAAMASMADLKLWAEDKLDLPVLFLRAGRHEPPGEATYLRTLFPRIDYRYIQGVSHYLMLEQSETTNQEILSFLKGKKKL